MEAPNENEMPLADGVGSGGKQERGTGHSLPDKPQSGLPVVKAIEKGLAATPRALGEFGSIMLAGAARQLENENHELKAKAAKLRISLDERRDALERQRIRNAVLTEQVESERGVKHLRSFGITAGTALLSAGLFHDHTIIDVFDLALIVGGALLLLVSWFSPVRRNKNTPAAGSKT